MTADSARPAPVSATSAVVAIAATPADVAQALDRAMTRRRIRTVSWNQKRRLATITRPTPEGTATYTLELLDGGRGHGTGLRVAITFESPLLGAMFDVEMVRANLAYYSNDLAQQLAREVETVLRARTSTQGIEGG